MTHFWKYVRLMFQYKRLIVIGAIAALIDAACAFSGFYALMWIIRQLFGERQTVQQMILEQLSDPDLQEKVGDLTHLADYIPSTPFGGFLFIICIILVLTIIGSTMRFIHQLCSVTVSLRTIMDIRRRVYQRLIHVPLELIIKEGMADKLSRLVRDCNALSRGFNTLMGKAVRDVLMGTSMIILAFCLDWKLTAIFLLGLPIIGVLIRKFGKRIRRATKKELAEYGGMIGAVQEALQAPQVVKVNQAEGYERRRFNTINRRVLKREMKSRIVRALSSPVIEMIGLIGVMAVALIAVWYLYLPEHSEEQQTAIAASFLQVLLALGAAGVSFRPLANLNNELQVSAAAAVRIDEMLELPVEPNVRNRSTSKGKTLPRHQKNIAFDNVSYAYPDQQQPAVCNLTLSVPYGSTVAIVGPNGSGKSTLLTLLPRLTNPTTGCVKIDGQDIADVSLKSLRSQMAVVTQRSVLFEGTIADNIAYGYRHATREKIISAAKSAFVDDFVKELPNGYDTMLGENGSGLSGGQQQRICIARAVLRNPAILILDEATSQIDADSEAKINDALKKLRHGRTTFVIAHRLSTVIDADQIVVINEGQIADIGKHNELLARCELYKTLTRTQM